MQATVGGVSDADGVDDSRHNMVDFDSVSIAFGVGDASHSQALIRPVRTADNRLPRGRVRACLDTSLMNPKMRSFP